MREPVSFNGLTILGFWHALFYSAFPPIEGRNRRLNVNLQSITSQGLGSEPILECCGAWMGALHGMTQKKAHLRVGFESFFTWRDFILSQVSPMSTMGY